MLILHCYYRRCHMRARRYCDYAVIIVSIFTTLSELEHISSFFITLSPFIRLPIHSPSPKYAPHRRHTIGLPIISPAPDLNTILHVDSSATIACLAAFTDIYRQLTETPKRPLLSSYYQCSRRSPLCFITPRHCPSTYRHKCRFIAGNIVYIRLPIAFAECFIAAVYWRHCVRHCTTRYMSTP